MHQFDWLKKRSFAKKNIIKKQVLIKFGCASRIRLKIDGE